MSGLAPTCLQLSRLCLAAVVDAFLERFRVLLSAGKLETSTIQAYEEGGCAVAFLRVRISGPTDRASSFDFIGSITAEMPEDHQGLSTGSGKRPKHLILVETVVLNCFWRSCMARVRRLTVLFLCPRVESHRKVTTHISS